MTAELVAIPRPKRWDVPFGPDMTDAAVAHLLTFPPFNRMDPQRFAAAVPLHGLLRNDARLHRCQRGDIIVRAGDYLNSAFFILSGTCRIEMGAMAGSLPDAVLGRRPAQRKGLLQVLAQLWNHRWPEVRDPARERLDERVGKRGQERQTRIYLQDVQNVLDTHRTLALTAGQSFGETAALSRTPREFTVFAETEVELVEVRWQGLRDLMRRDDALRQHAEATFRERALKSFLANTPQFAHLQPAELDAVAHAAVFESYGSYDRVSRFRDVAVDDFAERLRQEPVIAEEGQYVNGLYMVRNGLVRLTTRANHGQRTIAYLIAGQTYGADELAAGVPMRHTLRAVGYVNLIIVPAAIIDKYAAPRERRPLPPRERQALPVVAARPPAAPAAAMGGDLLEFMVENRFINGTASMVIDLDRCTRCDDCVRACADAHDNNPRFLRNGPRHGQYMVANACMHCQDPVCMIECPTGAIHRDLTAGVVVINDATCIGCSACARNCPYDAIRMVEVHDVAGNPIVDAATSIPISKATKCDLCIDQWGGPACQRACPHDALKRVDLRDLESFAGWLNR